MEEKLIKLTIDNHVVEVPQGTTLLEAGKMVGIDIQDQTDLRKKTEKAVRVFAGFHQKCLFAADTVNEERPDDE